MEIRKIPKYVTVIEKALKEECGIAEKEAKEYIEKALLLSGRGCFRAPFVFYVRIMHSET